MSTEEEKALLRRQQGRRLRAAREHLNLRTATEGAAFLKLPNSTSYSHHENGTRGMGRASADYAAKFGVPEEWLLRGKNPPDWALGEPEDAVEDPEHYLSAWRVHAGLTVEDLADKVAAPTELIRGWEAGGEISTKWLSRLATALGTTPGSILDADPGAIPRDLLELWRKTAQAQNEVREQVKKLSRTGTDG